VYGVVLTYNDLSTDSHFQPSAGLSDTTNKRFAWRMATAFGGSVPDLRVRLYDADTGGLLVDDDSDTADGTWEESTNTGSSWSGFANTDKANDNHYVRYTPASLGDGIKVRALLTLL